MEKIGILFGDILEWKNKPFNNERLNQAYEKFSRIALGKGIKILISSFSLCDDGMVKKAWYYDIKEKQWKKTKKVMLDLIYDRFRSNKINDTLKKNVKDGVRIFNNLELNDICWDKFLTYVNFPEFVPKTMVVNNNKEFNEAKKILKSEKIVIKPRYGIQGYGVFFKDKKERTNIKSNTVIQEFLDSSDGIKALGIRGVHDLRVILVNGKIDHSYVRIAKKGKLKTNCSLGGEKIFLKPEDLPQEVMKIIDFVDKNMKQFGERIYTIDFAFDKNQRPWIIELESIPGFSYYDGAESFQEKFLENIIQVLNNVISNEKEKKMVYNYQEIPNLLQGFS